MTISPLASLRLVGLALALVAGAACGDDDPVHRLTSVTRSYDARAAGGDASAPSDADGGDATTATGGTDATTDTGATAADTDVAGPDDVPALACDRAARLAACDDPLLDPAPAPSDADDPLYYVNRAFAVPEAYPISATSGWTPCSGGSAPGGVSHDLVCLPDAYTTQPVSLRTAAWDAPAPAGISTTSDGKAVGHEGRVGFKAAFDAALAEGAGELFAASCFRAYATQEAVFSGYVAAEMGDGLDEAEATIAASTYSAFPGHSEHQLATTCDLVYRKPNGQVSSFGRATAREMHASAPMTWLRDNGHRFGLVLTYAHDRVDVTHYVWEPWHWRFVGVEAADVMHRCALDTEELLNARYQAGALPPYAGDALILYDGLAVLAGDGTRSVDPGERLDWVWRLENTGSLAWGDALLGHVAGDDFGAGDVPVTCTPPLAVSDVALPLVAPTEPGLHEGTWRLVGDDGAERAATDLTVRLFVRGGATEGDPYRFIRVDDLSNAVGTADPGLDLDAIVVERAGEAPFYATRVASYTSSSPVAHDAAADALGAPDVFTAFPAVTTCDLDGGYVSLGGAGTIVLELAEPILEGDVVHVLEVGACDYGGGTAIADPYRARVSVGDGLAGAWETLGTSPGGPGRFSVPFLPPRSR